MNTNLKGWLVTGAATSINLIIGILYVWSIMGKALVTDYGWSNTQASLPYTVSIVTFALVMIFAGRLQDKKGPRMNAILSAIMLGTGLIISGLFIDPMILILSYGIMVGAGIGLGYAATTPPALKWFPPAKKGMISGIVVAGVALSAVYVSPLTTLLLRYHSLSTTLVILGIGAGILIIFLSFFLIDPPVVAKEKNQATTLKNCSEDLTWRQLLTEAKFKKMWFMYAFAASAGLMLIGHLATIAKTQSGWENGFYLVIILAVFNALGRIIAGLISDHVGYLPTMRFIFILQSINMFFFATYQTPLTLGLGAAVAGLGYGALFSLFPSITASYYGLKNLGVNYGLLFTAFGFAGVIGPLSAGKIVDITGSYSLSYSVSACLLLLALGITFIMKDKA